jgi:hypothetical protein
MFNLLNVPFHFLNNIILRFLHILTPVYNQSCSSVALLLENGWNFWCVLTVKSEVSELHINSATVTRFLKCPFRCIVNSLFVFHVGVGSKAHEKNVIVQ